LDAEKRELLALRFAGQLTAPEIAAVVGKSPEAVKRQLTRIVHALKEQFHGDE
jgi:RNA polymerase sigma-70 factor (ECF subfamily)